MLTLATWKRICFKERNLAAYVDFTLQWDSEGTQHLMNDATQRLVMIYQQHKEWDEAEWMSPRGTAKTTIGIIAWSWLNKLYPWLQTVFISATPDVTMDAYEYAVHLARHHPLLGTLRPRGVANAQKREFDTPGRRGKGRSFRARTGGNKITGIRAHFVDVDDLEVKETVTTPAQRMKMRLTLAETKNLLFKRHWFAKTIMRGTPWDELTIYRERMVKDQKQPIVQVRDRVWHMEVPGWYVDEETNKVVYPFNLLPPDELNKIRDRLNNDMLFRYQYLLDTTRDNLAMPIDENDLIFQSFESTILKNKILIIDPAGSKFTAEERSAIMTGAKRGDMFSIGAYGTRGGTLYQRKMWAESSIPRVFLDKVVEIVRWFNPSRIWVESNFNAWSENIKMRLDQEGLRHSIMPFHSSQDKLSKILSELVPRIGSKRFIMHEEDRNHKEQRAQLLGLRYDQLPKPNDDIIDNQAMACMTLGEYLHVERPKNLTPVEKAVALHAPNSVIKQIERQTNPNTRRIAVTSASRFREGL